MDLKAYVVGDVQHDGRPRAGRGGAGVADRCANASNLLVARVTSRRRELAVRAALGASRGRVVRYLLAESALLASARPRSALSLAWAGVRLLRPRVPPTSRARRRSRSTARCSGCWPGVTIASGVLFGLVPALYGAGGPVDESLRSMGASATGSLAVRRLRRGLVASQFAIATPLLVVAGLLLVSLNALRHVDLGFDTRNVLTGAIRLPAAQYPERASVAFWDELKRRVEALPGVSGVAFADGRPPDGVGNFNNFDLEDHPTPAGQSQPVTPWVAVTPEYFRVLGLTLLEGRLLDERERAADEARSRRRRSRVGEAVLSGRERGRQAVREGGCTQCPWTTVVGVVSEVKYAGLDQPDEGTVYSPLDRGGLSRVPLHRRANGDGAADAAPGRPAGRPRARPDAAVLRTSRPWTSW